MHLALPIQPTVIYVSNVPNHILITYHMICYIQDLVKVMVQDHKVIVTDLKVTVGVTQQSPFPLRQKHMIFFAKYSHSPNHHFCTISVHRCGIVHIFVHISVDVFMLLFILDLNDRYFLRIFALGGNIFNVRFRKIPVTLKFCLILFFIS